MVVGAGFQPALNIKRAVFQSTKKTTGGLKARPYVIHLRRYQCVKSYSFYYSSPPSSSTPR